jgi:DNA-binding cell septation regulator SpoVG
MKLEARIFHNQSGNILAGATLTIDGAIVIKGFKIIKGAKGNFISAPQRKVPDPNKPDGFTWVDIAHAVTAEARQQINDAIMGAFNATGETQEQPPMDYQEQNNNDCLPF